MHKNWTAFSKRIEFYIKDVIKKMNDDSCTVTTHKAMLNCYRQFAIYLFGISQNDRTALAEMAVVGSITELRQAENETKEKLRSLAIEIKKQQKLSNRPVAVQRALIQSRECRKTLTSLNAKITGMEAHLEKLRQSKINQSLIASMKQTNAALQAHGLQVEAADSAMLDFEDLRKDVEDTSNSLGTFCMDYDDDELAAELEIMLSEDSTSVLIPTSKPKSKPAEITTELSALPLSASDEANGAVQLELSCDDDKRDDNSAPPPTDSAELVSHLVKHKKIAMPDDPETGQSSSRSSGHSTKEQRKKKQAKEVETAEENETQLAA